MAHGLQPIQQVQVLGDCDDARLHLLSTGKLQPSSRSRGPSDKSSLRTTWPRSRPQPGGAEVHPSKHRQHKTTISLMARHISQAIKSSARLFSQLQRKVTQAFFASDQTILVRREAPNRDSEIPRDDKNSPFPPLLGANPLHSGQQKVLGEAGASEEVEVVRHDLELSRINEYKVIQQQKREERYKLFQIKLRELEVAKQRVKSLRLLIAEKSPGKNSRACFLGHKGKSLNLSYNDQFVQPPFPQQRPEMDGYIVSTGVSMDCVCSKRFGEDGIRDISYHAGTSLR